jgi:hypothetical protein
MNNRHYAQSTVKQQCDFCGALAHEDFAGSCLPWGNAWFCDDCWRSLPAAELQRISRSLAPPCRAGRARAADAVLQQGGAVGTSPS